MKTKIRKLTAILLATLMLACLFVGTPASAAEAKPFTLHVQSNMFPEKTFFYSDLTALENESGEVFLTVDFELLAAEKYLINLDVDELAWDNTVLEFKEADNKMGTGRNARFCIFPFAFEQGLGTGMANTFGDDNCGRLVGNYTSVLPAAYAYEEDGSAVTLVRARFKVLDKDAGSTTVSCMMDTVSLCDDDKPEPFAQYTPISACVLKEDDIALSGMTTGVSVSPEAAELLIGDADGDGTITINDATVIQSYLAEMSSTVDFSDPAVIACMDANKDGKVDVRDVTAIQRMLINN